MAGRNWTVDEHPQRDALITAIVEGKSSLRTIAKQFDINHVCVSRYLNERLSTQAAAVAQQRAESEGSALIDKLLERDKRVEKMLDACDKYLQDPNNPGEYDLFPRAWEIDVTYRTVEDSTGHMITRKESLQSLIDKMDGQGYQPWEIKYRHADPRKLLLEASRDLRATLELQAKLAGKLADVTINMTFNQYWTKIKAIIMDATKGHPEVRAAIIAKMEEGQDGQ